MILALLTRFWRPLVGVLVFVVVVGSIYALGRNHERKAWKAKYEAALIAAAKETHRLVEKNYAIEQRIVATVTRERVVTRNLIEQVPVHVPVDSCPLPAGFRLLHDAAARGDDPAAAVASDAAAVPAQDAARTVLDNYGACRETAQRLTALQEWARDVASTPILCQ